MRFKVSLLFLSLPMFCMLCGCPSGTLVVVPNVVNSTQEAAEDAITGAGLIVGQVTGQASQTIAAGRVISQSPVAGASVPLNAAVSLVVSTGSGMTSVPNLVNLTQQAAQSAITGAGLTVGQVTSQSSQTIAVGRVISHTPSAGTNVVPGSAVSLVVSTGPAPSLAWSYIASSASVWGRSVDLCADGGCVVGGGFGIYNLHALRLSSTGALQWSNLYSSKDPYNYELWPYAGHGARQTSDGGFIITGSGHEYLDGRPARSYVLVKLDSAGDIDWSGAYAPSNPLVPGTYCSDSRPTVLEVTADGGYFVAGSSGVGGNRYLAVVLKTDSDGDVEFLNVINDNGGAYDQHICDGQQTADGGYILVGSGVTASGYTALLIKTDAEGDLEWSGQYQDVAQGYGAEAYAVAQTSDGGYIIGGELFNSITKALGHGCWLAKIDNDGDVVWLRNYGYDLTLQSARAIAETPDGNFVAAGAVKNGKMALAKFNQSGELLWNCALSTLPAATANDIALTPQGGCILVGSSTSSDTVVAKINHVFLVE